MTETEMILSELREVKKDIREDIKKLFDSVDSLMVGATTVSTKFEGHLKSCDGRHKHDGNLGRAAITKAIEWGVVAALIIIIGKGMM